MRYILLGEKMELTDGETSVGPDKPFVYRGRLDIVLNRAAVCIEFDGNDVDIERFWHEAYGAVGLRRLPLGMPRAAKEVNGKSVLWFPVLAANGLSQVNELLMIPKTKLEGVRIFWAPYKKMD